jgi:hypothetical protein
MSDESQKLQHDSEVPANQDELSSEELDNVAGGFTMIERGNKISITDGTSNTLQGGIADGTLQGLHPGGAN